MIRYLLWNAVCWRGRRCADLTIAGTELGEDVDPDLVAGTSIALTFVCGKCRRVYRREALITGPCSVVHLDRVRIG